MKAQSRQSLLASIHMYKKDLGLTESEYRALVQRVTGHDSCGKAAYNALIAMVVELRAIKRGKTPVVGEECRGLLSKINALLLDMDLHWNYAHGIADKMFGKRMDALGFAECNAVLTALVKRRGAGDKKAAGRRAA